MRGVAGTSLTVMLMTQGVGSVMANRADNGPEDWGYLIDKHKVLLRARTINNNA